MLKIYARQGDLVINETTIPKTETLTKAKNPTFAGDSSGHPHVLQGEHAMARNDARILVRVAKPAELTHGRGGGHKTVTLKAGDYEIRPLRERGGAGDRAVED